MSRRTFREIGTRLFISANTEANHIRSILMKTGTANRTQAARYATEQGMITASGAQAARARLSHR